MDMGDDDYWPKAGSSEAVIMAYLHKLERTVDKLEAKVEQHQTVSKGDIRELRRELEDLKTEASENVSFDRYRPVERLVFGAVALILIAVCTSIIALVVRR